MISTEWGTEWVTATWGVLTHRVRLSGADRVDRTTGAIATSNATVLPNVPSLVSEVIGKDGTRTLTVNAKGATWKD